MLSVIGALVGGLGLFLLAVGLMTDGLQHATGSALRQILAKWTNSVQRGITSGFLMTALVQSSSAVTLATVGFVNAGLLTMRQALGIVYGANIGTTITAWLVALIGFKVDLAAFALPMIGIGMILRLLKPGSKAAAYGLALVGFGLFFVGIDTLKDAFEGLVTALDITKITALGVQSVLLFVLIGIVMTVLTQSSSASIAITIAAASSGMIGLYAAAALIIGANVGTTSTAVFASIGTTANSRRVALAQVLFNVMTGIVALLLLPLLFLLINFLSDVMQLSQETSVTLAMFHSTFNILGVLLVLPFNDRLATFLEGRFVTREDTDALPRYLDKTLIATPVLAVNTLVLELESIAERVSTLLQQLISHHVQRPQLHQQVNIIRKLSEEISRYTVDLSRGTLSAETTEHLATVLRIDQYLLNCANQSDTVVTLLEQCSSFDLHTVTSDLDGFRNALRTWLDMATQEQLMEVDYDNALIQVQTAHDTLKARLLMAATTQSITVAGMLSSVELASDLLILMTQWIKARKYLQQMHTDTAITDKLAQESASQNPGSSSEEKPPTSEPEATP